MGKKQCCDLLLLFHMSTFPLGLMDEALTRLVSLISFSSCIRPSHCDHFFEPSCLVCKYLCFTAVVLPQEIVH